MMKKKFLIGMLLTLLLAAQLNACANDDEESKSGAVESFTENKANEITTSIKKPLNKARLVKNTGQDRMKNVDGMVQEQKE
jgi:hypothetical protein